MALDKLYQQIVLDHNRSPRNFGSLPGATHSARGQDALCGDDIVMEVVIEGGRIRQAAFSGEACAVTKASASMLTEWVGGRRIAEVEIARQAFQQALDDPDGPDDPLLQEINHLRAVGHFPARKRNALLPWQTLSRAMGGK